MIEFIIRIFVLAAHAPARAYQNVCMWVSWRAGGVVVDSVGDSGAAAAADTLILCSAVNDLISLLHTVIFPYCKEKRRVINTHTHT